MNYITENHDPIRIIHLMGNVDVPNACILRDALGRAANNAEDRVLVDLTDVSMLDSSGIGVLVAAQRRARTVGARFALAAPRERVARVLNMTGTTGLLDIHSSVAEAEAALAA